MSYGVSFDPVPDAAERHFLHIVSDEALHLAVDTESGAVHPQSPLTYDPADPDNGSVDPAISSLAYAPSVDGAIGVDARSDSPPHLAEVTSPAGVLESRGVLSGLSTNHEAGLDRAADGSVFGVFTPPAGGFSRLWRIEPDASAVHLGRFGPGRRFESLALPPTGVVEFDADAVTQFTPSPGSTTFEVLVERNTVVEEPYGDLTLDVEVVGGDAEAGTDFALTTTQVLFPHGSSDPQPVDVEVTRPADAQGDVTVELGLTDAGNVGNFVGDDDTFEFTIKGAEAAVVAFDDDVLQVSETTSAGDDGEATLNINRVGGDGQVSALLRVKETGASDEATRGDDYDFPSEGRTVEFGGGAETVGVRVPIVNDTDFEDDEVAVFDLVEPSTGAEIGTPSEFTLTINDDPTGTVGFDSDQYEVSEGDSVEIVVERVDGNEDDTAVTVTDSGTGTAVAGTDYEAFGPSPHTFGGDNDDETRTFRIPVQTTATPGIDDDRTIVVDLAKTGPADLATNEATIIIRDRTVGGAFLVTDDGKLASFDPDDPATVSEPVTVMDGEDNDVVLVGIDFRPTDQDEPKLYGVAVGDPTQPGETTQVYEIDDPVLGTGNPVPVKPIDIAGVMDIPYPAAPGLPGENFGVDFDATDDTLRVVSDLGGHLIFDASTWQWTPGTPFAYGPGDVAGDGPDDGFGMVPQLTAVAHDQNVHPNLVTSETSSTAYAIDVEADTLVRIDTDPAGELPTDTGVLVTIGGSSVATDARAGLDITTDGRGYAVLTDEAESESSLYTIDLDDGTASPVGVIDGGTDGHSYTDLALAPTGVIKFDEDSYTVVGEDGGETEKTLTIGVERVGGTAGEVTVDFAAGDGGDDATPGDDYTLDPGSLVFDSGSTTPSGDITLTIHDDEIYEGDEDLTVTLSNLEGALFENGDLTPSATLDATVTIGDDRVGTLTFDGAPFTVNEPDESATIGVTRAGGGEGVLTVGLSTAAQTPGDNSATPDDDYNPTPNPSTLTFTHGSADTTESSTVTIVDDNAEELDEALDVKMENWSEPHAAPASNATTLTIHSEDNAGSVSLSSPTYEVSEDAGFVTVTLDRVDGSDGALIVEFNTIERTAQGAATAGVDYTSIEDLEVVFGHGETTGTVSVPILDEADFDLEGDETFDVQITGVTEIPGRENGIVSSPSAVVVIRDAEPGSLFAVVADSDGDGAQELVRFDSARPDSASSIGPISGLVGGEQVVALDRRPANGEYYALGADGSAGATLYLLDPSTGSLTTLGSLVNDGGHPFPVAEQAGMAIDPVRDVFRIVDTDGQNLRVEFPDAPPTPLIVIEDNPVWYGDGRRPEIAGVAFTNATGGATTQYDVDLEQEQVAQQGDEDNAEDAATADTGELHDAGDLLSSPPALVGFEVDQYDRILATLSATGTSSTLYEVRLGGEEEVIGDLLDGSGGGLIADAIAATPSAGAVGFAGPTLAAVEEGAGGTHDVTVQRVGGTGEVTFKYRVTDAEGNDITPEGDTRTIGETDGDVTITVPIPDDTVYRHDADNELQLQIYDVTGGAEPGVVNAILPVTDDDRPTVSIAPLAVTVDPEGDDGDSTAVGFTLTLSNPTARDTQVTVSTEDGTGSTGAVEVDGDYVGLDGEVVTIDSNVETAPSKPFTGVFVEGDTIDEEDDETFSVIVDSADEADLHPNEDEAIVTIRDDDDPPTVSVIAPDPVTEGHVGETKARIPVRLSEVSGKTVTVRAATSDGTATVEDGDYVATEEDLVFLPGDEEKFFEVPVNGDVMDEEDESFTVTLSDLDNADPGVLSATVTIENDDDPPEVSVGGVAIREGIAEAVVPVTLSEVSGKTVTVHAATSDGTATADDDYVVRSEDLTFEPGVTTRSFVVPLRGDALDEFDERFTVTLSDLDNADPGVLSATVTIEDDDDPPSVSIGDTTVIEGDSGTTDMIFPILLSAPSAKTIQVRGDTADGTATAGEDYVPVSGVATFEPGMVARAARVRVIGDTVDEPDETFRVVLSDPINAGIADRTAVGTIVDDDEPPVVKGVTAEAAPVNSQSTPDGDGYWISTPEGDVFGFGNAERFGSLRGTVATAQVAAPVVDLEATTDGDGYWLLDDQGGVHTFGSARFFGSLPARILAGLIGQAEATDMARTPDGAGYLVLDAVGGVHTFGDARFFGSIPGRIAAGQDIAPTRFVSIAVTPGGDGYWILDEHGGVHTFGTAGFSGSIPGRRAAGQDIGTTRFVNIAVTPGGDGYWILDEHGGVHTFGTARFFGSIPSRIAAGQNIGHAGATSIEPAPGGKGYWIFDDAGGVFTFGEARFAGSVPGLRR